MRNIDTCNRSAASVSCNSALIENCEQSAARRCARPRRVAQGGETGARITRRYRSADPFSDSVDLNLLRSAAIREFRSRGYARCRLPGGHARHRAALDVSACVFARQIDKSRAGPRHRKLWLISSAPWGNAADSVARRQSSNDTFDRWSGIILANGNRSWVWSFLIKFSSCFSIVSLSIGGGGEKHGDAHLLRCSFEMINLLFCMSVWAIYSNSSKIFNILDIFVTMCLSSVRFLTRDESFMIFGWIFMILNSGMLIFWIFGILNLWTSIWQIYAA